MTDTGPSTLTRTATGARLLLLFCVLPSAGCAVWGLADRTLHTELAEYPRVSDGYLSKQIYHQWGQTEWEQALSQSPHLGESPEYRKGFLEGFVDYVCRGGDGEPPVIPPRRFWQITYRSPAGDAALAEWSQGFRHGAQVAHAKGYRRRAVVPPTTAFAPSPSGELPYASDLVPPGDETLQFDMPVMQPLEELPTGPPAGQGDTSDRSSTVPRMLSDESAISQGPLEQPSVEPNAATGGTANRESPSLPEPPDANLFVGPQDNPPRLQLGSPRALDSRPQRDMVRMAQRDPLDHVIGSGADPKLSLTSPHPLAELTARQAEPPPAAQAPQDVPDDLPSEDAAPALADQLPPPPPWFQGPANAESSSGSVQSGSAEPPPTGAWRARDK